MIDIGPETLDRTVKQLIDSGEASVEEAYAIFAGFRLVVEVGPSQLEREDSQAALITLVSLATRVFHGGVYVTGCDASPLLAPLPLGSSIYEAVVRCGGKVDGAPDDAPRVSIGAACGRKGRFHVRTVFSGWRAGVVPVDFPDGLSDMTRPTAMPMAPVLAASLAVAEAFEYVSGRSTMAGHFPVGMSLWSPDQRDWLASSDVEPVLSILPSKLWLIGLGHIGQAYLWCLGLLPYQISAPLHLLLQDIDTIGPSTSSTSILTSGSTVGRRKTREMAAWVEQRGFHASIIERHFDARFHVSEIDPSVALCGLDNLQGRRALDKVGFGLVIEAGLGSKHDDFRSLRLHTLPGRRSAEEIWKDESEVRVDDIPDEYKRLGKAGVLDQCGITLLAGKAVGAAFVGCCAAALAISELLRFLHGGPLYESIDLDLRAVDHRSVAVNVVNMSNFNPGFVDARHEAGVWQR